MDLRAPDDIPFRSLVAKNMSNLLLAGCCVSGNFFAHASYRVTGNAVAMGEAAGLAATLASHASDEVGNVDPRQLRDLLRENGALLP